MAEGKVSTETAVESALEVVEGTVGEADDLDARLKALEDAEKAFDSAYSTGKAERANREVKRRGRVVQVFPSRKSLIRLIGAVLSEMDEDWQEKRWFTEASIAEVYEKP